MKTVAFFGECGARSEKTLASPMIQMPYRIKKIHARFPLGSVNRLALSFFHSYDDSTPATGKPTGQNILQEMGQVDFIVGDGDEKELEHEVDVDESNTYLKVYANNSDFYPHDIDVQIYLEMRGRE